MASAHLDANGVMEASDFNSDVSETSLRCNARKCKFLEHDADNVDDNFRCFFLHRFIFLLSKKLQVLWVL